MESTNQTTPVNALASFVATNLLFTATGNIVKHDNGDVEFDSIYKYAILEHIVLKADEVPLWDLFNSFDTVKNAVAVLQHTLETLGEITNESFKLQGKITPETTLKVQDFTEFLALLTPEAQNFLKQVATKWVKKTYNGESTFDAFFINGTDGLTFSNGDYVVGYDSVYSQQVVAKVLCAVPNGYVAVIDASGIVYSLSSKINAKIVSRELIDSEIASILDESVTEATQKFQADKDAKMVQVEKMLQKQAEKQAEDAIIKAKFDKVNGMPASTPDEVAKVIAALKAEKLPKTESDAIKAKIEPVKLAEYSAIKAITLDSKEKIKEATDRLNIASLDKAKHDEIKAAIKIATEALKKAAKNDEVLTDESESESENSPSPEILAKMEEINNLQATLLKAGTSKEKKAVNKAIAKAQKELEAMTAEPVEQQA